MSKKKGLSMSEKKSKLLEIFHETKDVYQLKDLEKIAPKSKGIVMQSVKSVLQELTDDGHVETSKIGSSVYFWSFPGNASKEIIKKLEELEIKLKNANIKISALQELVEFDRLKYSDQEKLTKMQEENEHLKKQKNQIEMEIKNSKELDPQAAQKKLKENSLIFDAANRWTDNVFTVKSWCKNKFGMLDKDLDKNFDIPDDFDYLE